MQSQFKMIYGHVSLSQNKKNYKIHYTLFEPKIKINSFFSFPNTLDKDHQHAEIQFRVHIKSFLIRDPSKKECIKRSQQSKGRNSKEKVSSIPKDDDVNSQTKNVLTK